MCTQAAVSKGWLHSSSVGTLVIGRQGLDWDRPWVPGSRESPDSAVGLLLPLCLVLTSHSCGPGSAPALPAPLHILVSVFSPLWSWPCSSLWVWPSWGPVPKRHCQHSMRTLHKSSLWLGQPCLGVTAAVTLVPRMVPNTSQMVLHTNLSTCQDANSTLLCSHTNPFPRNWENWTGSR